MMAHDKSRDVPGQGRRDGPVALIEPLIDRQGMAAFVGRFADMLPMAADLVQ